MDHSEARKIAVDGSGVSALWSKPRQAVACFVFAHGADAGMTHPFMEAVAGGLFEWNIATLRYQFPYRERGSRRPDAGNAGQLLHGWQRGRSHLKSCAT
jgi:predicted alpha/beta-hydrolase family hydrolase